MIPRALSIAGVDSSGGAGVVADCTTFRALGVFPIVAVTAVTVQDTTGVHAVHGVQPEIVAAQIRAVAQDIGIDAAKTGMLVSAAHVEAVAQAVIEAGLAMLVVDPVILSSSGHELLDEAGVDALVARLLPLAAVVTPNAAEAERLSGRPVRTTDDAAEAARAIAKLGPAAVVVTGGHLDGQPTDVLFDGSEQVSITGTRIDGVDLHGTGCIFSAALTAGLAKGLQIEAAVRGAKDFVSEAIKHGVVLGRGRRSVDPTWWYQR